VEREAAIWSSNSDNGVMRLQRQVFDVIAAIHIRCAFVIFLLMVFFFTLINLSFKTKTLSILSVYKILMEKKARLC
jgi:hypothetical protein